MTSLSNHVECNVTTIYINKKELPDFARELISLNLCRNLAFKSPTKLQFLETKESVPWQHLFPETAEKLISSFPLGQTKFG